MKPLQYTIVCEECECEQYEGTLLECKSWLRNECVDWDYGLEGEILTVCMYCKNNIIP